MSPWKPESKVLISDSIVPDFFVAFPAFCEPPRHNPGVASAQSSSVPLLYVAAAGVPVPTEVPEHGGTATGVNVPVVFAKQDWGEGPRGFASTPMSWLLPTPRRSRQLVLPPYGSPSHCPALERAPMGAGGVDGRRVLHRFHARVSTAPGGGRTSSKTLTPLIQGLGHPLG